MYPNTSLFIDGTWAPGSTGKDEAVLNPATAEEIGRQLTAQNFCVLCAVLLWPGRRVATTKGS